MGKCNEMSYQWRGVDSHYAIKESEVLWLNDDECHCQDINGCERLIEHSCSDIVLMSSVGIVYHARYGKQYNERQGY